MRLHRFFDEGLAHASFLLGCEPTGDAFVIDPRRDVDAYLAAASQQGLRITTAIETHIHADFVSGARELSALGAATICGPGAALGFPHRSVRHGETLKAGDLTLTFLHTPGHTPEHISILAEAPGQPRRVFTGDTLFVGAVGRPDLLGKDLSRALANQLYDSLATLLELDDEVEVHPTHGAGSLCGKGIGKEPSSTIGFERRFNPWLQHQTREAFVAAVLADLPETPPYFQRMKRVNEAGPPLLGLDQPPSRPDALDAATVATRLAAGALLLDLRDASAFGAAHPRGAINLGFDPRLGYWAGWLLPPDFSSAGVPAGGPRIILLTEDQRQIDPTVRQLLRVGIDRIEGVLVGGMAAWHTAGLPEGRVAQVDASSFRDLLAQGPPPVVIDVRTSSEWRDGHLPGARNIPLGDLPQRTGEIPQDTRIFTVCSGGYRSSVAASLLARAGHPGVVNVAGGMSAYRKIAGTEGRGD